MAGSYTLQIEAFGVYAANMPSLEIWEDGVLHSTHAISSAGSSFSVTINYGGALPTSLAFTFNDGFAAAGRTIEIRSVRIDNQYVNVGNYLSTDSLTKSATATVDVAGPVFLFDASDPALSEFTTGATRTMTAGNDTFRDFSGATNEIFDALGGRDVLYLGSGDDKVFGNAGADIIYAGGGDDLISGGDDDDYINGQAGNDRLYGGNGDDRIHGEDGDDEIYGGAGNDTLNGHAGADTIVGGAGADKINGGDDNDILYGGADDDQIVGGNGNDTIDGGAGDDVAYGGAGADHIDGGDGNDYLIGNQGDDTVNGGAGNDIILGLQDNDTLYGSAGDDEIYGGIGNDTIDGGANQDRIYGNDGDDIIGGGDDHDIIYGDGGAFARGWEFAYYDLGSSPTTLATAGFTLNGGMDNSNVATSRGVNQVLNPSFYDAGDNYAIKYETYLTITTAGNYSFRTSSDDGSALFLDGVLIVNNDGLHGVVNVTSAAQALTAGVYKLDATFFERTGGNVMDVLMSGPDTGGSFVTLSTYAAVNAANGAGDVSSGDDIIDAGAGNDTVYGDAGNDTISGGTGNDVLYGDTGNDTLNGDAGIDTLTGGVGVDVIDGGADDDTILLANGDFAAGESLTGGAGTDNITLTNPTTVDFSIGTIATVENLNGSTGNDDVTYTIQQALAFSAINLLGGTDTSRVRISGVVDATILGVPTVTNTENGFVVGSAGADTLTISGAQLDALIFGTGTIDFSGGADVLNLTSTSSDLNTLGATNASIVGLETISASTAAAGVTINMTGQTEGFTITGSNNADIITGGTGADIINGGAGNDTINLANGHFAAGETLTGGADTDNITLTNATTIDFSTGTIATVENLIGSSGNDDVTYSIQQALAFTSINLGGGTDASRARISGTVDVTSLGTPTVTNTENGFVVGSAGADALTISGAQLDALIFGTGTIDFSGGADVLNLTSTSADLNTLGATNASIVGLETISASTAAAGVTINMTGQTEGFTITGSNNADIITGGTGADIINGGNGNDTINAGGGNDRIISDLGNDIIDGGTGIDTLDASAYTAYVTIDLSLVTAQVTRMGTDTISNIENLIGSGFNDTLRGNSGVNQIDGGAGNDNIYGGDGVDTINGGDGVDNIYGEAGADIINGDAGNDNFWITGTDSLGDQYNGGADTDYVRLQANSYMNLANTFTDVEYILYNGFDIIAEVNGGFNLTSTLRSGTGNLLGQGGDEVITGGDNTDYIYGFAGADTLSGGAGSDYIYGGDDDDTINGGDSTDYLYGGAGADTINGDAGNDNIYISGTDALGDQYNGGADTDSVRLEANTYMNLANTFTDVEYIVYGGFDIIADVGTGFNLTGTLKSGTGNLLGQGGAEVITGSDSADYIYGFAGTDTINGGLGSDYIYGGDDADILNGNEGNDDFFVGGTEGLGDQYDGGADSDDLQLLSAVTFNLATTFTNMELLRFNGFNITAVSGDGFNLSNMTRTGAGDLYGQAGNETITGTQGGDNIYGLDGDDTLNGFDGNDNIYGGAGIDTINGGLGNDNFYIAGTESLGDKYDGGGGTDYVRMTGDVYFNAANTFENLTSILTSGFNILSEANGGFDLTGQIISGGSFLYGNTGSETIIGSNSADDIYGGAGADILSGGESDDEFFIGGTDALGDVYDGGNGNDYIRMDSATSFNSANSFTSIERLYTAGFDINIISGSTISFANILIYDGSNIYGDAAGNETITGSDAVDTIYGYAGTDILNGGLGNDDLYGGDDNDIINGDDGHDNIYGGAGVDTLSGGAGNDEFFIGAGSENLGDTYDGGADLDYIWMSADTDFNSANSFTDIERLYTGNFNINLVSGTTIDFSSLGIYNASNIYGTAGVENITGSFNGDNIYGGEGADILNGFDGNDNFWISGTESLGDVYDGGTGTDYIRMNADSYFNSANSFANLTSIINYGFDMYVVSGATVDFSSMTRNGAGDIFGDAGDETIIGFSNTNLIYGLGGADTMTGGTGNDSFYVSGTDSLGDVYNANGGTDYIRLDADSYFNSANVFNGIYGVAFNGFNMIVTSGSTVDFSGMVRSGTGQIHGEAGNEIITGMDNTDIMYGFAGNDTLDGGVGNDTLYGGADNDTLYGGDGLDDLYGEAGADIFVFENATAFNNIDSLRDYSTAENDAIDIKDLLSGYTYGVDDLTDFVQINDSGANSTIFVDVTGTGTFGAATQIGFIYGQNGITDEVALETAGHLITH